MEDPNCESCLYCGENGGCWLEKLEGIDPEECRNGAYKFFEEREQ